MTRATGWLTEVHWAVVISITNLCLFDGAEAFFMDGSQSVQCNRNGKNQVHIILESNERKQSHMQYSVSKHPNVSPFLQHSLLGNCSEFYAN